MRFFLVEYTGNYASQVWRANSVSELRSILPDHQGTSIIVPIDDFQAGYLLHHSNVINRNVNHWEIHSTKREVWI